MKYTLIDADKAPAKPPKTLSRMAKETHGLVGALVSGKVARVEPSEGESVRGLKESITRAAKRMDKNVRTWDHDGVVYAELS